MSSTFEIPSHFYMQYTADQISAAVKRIASEIDAWAAGVWSNSHTDILAIPVLRGGIFFFADLVRAIKHSVEITPAQTWAYELMQNNVQRNEVRLDLSQVPAVGREILLVDDICDSGRTLESLRSALLERGALSVRSAVLIKRVMSTPSFSPDWVGFEYKGQEWFVGYGMEDNERWRNLPGVYVIKR